MRAREKARLEEEADRKMWADHIDFMVKCLDISTHTMTPDEIRRHYGLPPSKE